MTQNPFETPYVDPQYAQVRPATGTIDIGESLSEAWSVCWENFPLWLGVGVVAMLVLTFAEMTIIGIFVIWPVIYYGWTKFLLNMLEPNRADFSDLFSGFNTFGAALLPMLAFGALCFVPFVPFIVALILESETMMIVTGIFMFLVYLVGMPKIAFSVFYIVDRNMGAIDAMKASIDATRGQWFTVFGLMVLAFAVQMAGYLALIIGVIPASQIAYLMFASAYRQLAGPEPARAY